MFSRTLVRSTILTAAGVLAVAGCSSPPTDDSAQSPTSSASASSSAASSPAAQPTSSAPTSSASAGGGHEGHEQDGGPAPAGIKPAASPKFPVGSKVVLSADHMPGMKGAEATVVGAFDTTTYAVDYTPTNGGAPVEDHKWVVHEELVGVGDTPLKEGDRATMSAEHMPGMKGAEATIVEVTTQPVYMVDVDADGMMMKNHKWVVEDEMSPAS